MIRRVLPFGIALLAACTGRTIPPDHDRIVWRGIPVQAENRCSEYSRDDYNARHPPDTKLGMVMDYGRPYFPYTGERFDHLEEAAIEHIVALSEAHDSGLCAASEARKEFFATDPVNLTLAPLASNRHDKGAKDAADWLPERNRCWFVDRVIQVRIRHGLTIDIRELEALEAVLTTCEPADLLVQPKNQ